MLIRDLLHTQVWALVLNRVLVKYNKDIGIPQATYMVEVHLKTSSRYLDMRRELKEALKYTVFHNLSEAISLNMNKKIHLTRVDHPSLQDLIRMSGVVLEARGAVTFDFLHPDSLKQSRSFYISNREMKRESIVKQDISKFPSVEHAVAVKMLFEMEQRGILEFRKKTGEPIQGLYPITIKQGVNDCFDQPTLF